MTDDGAELRRLAFYLVPDRPGETQVVQLLEIEVTTLVVEDPVTRERWTIRRPPFEARVRDGRAVPVEPRWEPANQRVEVDA